jgi:hypothetical protein
MNEVVVTGKKSTNNFEALITSGRGPDVARETPLWLR